MAENIDSEMARLNKFLAQAMGEIRCEHADPKLKFPNGLKWHYVRADKPKGFRDIWYCWSTTRNQNGKFVSWKYVWHGKPKHRVADYVDVLEHRYRASAKRRALKLQASRNSRVRKEGPLDNKEGLLAEMNKISGGL